MDSNIARLSVAVHEPQLVRNPRDDRAIYRALGRGSVGDLDQHLLGDAHLRRGRFFSRSTVLDPT